MEKIKAEDLHQPIMLTLIVSGGAPGERLEYEVTIDEAKGQVIHKHSDELKKIHVERVLSKVSSDTILHLKDILMREPLPVDETIFGPFAPDTIVGTLTVEAGDKRQVVRFPVEETPDTAFGPIPSYVSRNVRPESVSDAIRDIEHALTGEVERLSTA